MRAREILDEDYNQNLQSDIDNLLIGVKGNNVLSLPTQTLVNKLQSAGYSIDIDSLLTLLQNDPIVTNATPDTIELVPPSAELSGDDETQDSAARVNDMAQKATKI
jgi:hypothetical protein